MFNNIQIKILGYLGLKIIKNWNLNIWKRANSLIDVKKFHLTSFIRSFCERKFLRYTVTVFLSTPIFLTNRTVQKIQIDPAVFEIFKFEWTLLQYLLSLPTHLQNTHESPRWFSVFAHGSAWRLSACWHSAIKFHVFNLGSVYSSVSDRWIV